jgi:hypothetical protein
MAAVQQLASFFAQLLQALQASATATGPTAQHFSFSVPLGSLMVALQADFAGTTSSPVAGATVRQIAAVISIGVSSANSGGNTMVTSAASAGSAGAGGSIVTGNATAQNTSVVVVCQLNNSTATCLVPPVPPVDPGVTTTTAAVNAGGPLPAGVLDASARLPSTGGGLDPVAPATVLFLTGFVLLAVGRRRASR